MADLISQIKGLDNVTYDLQDKVSTFGNTNLISNSYNFLDTSNWTTNGTGVTLNVATTDDVSCLHATGTSTSSITGSGLNNCIPLEFQTQYTYHAWIKFAGTGIITSSAPLHLWVYRSATATGIGATNSGWSTISSKAVTIDGTTYTTNATLPANTWLHLICNFTTAAKTTDYPYINFRPFVYGNYVNTANSEWWIKGIKLEKSNKPTDMNYSVAELATYSNETITFFQ